MFSGLDRYERYGPLLLRLGIGVTMLLSGYGKVTGLAVPGSLAASASPCRA